MPNRKVVRQVLLYLSMGILFCAFLETTTRLNEKGNDHFKAKRYDSALESYQKAQVKSPADPTIRYNLGTTLYQMDQFQEAKLQLEKSLAYAKTNDLKATAWYNYGDTQYRLGQFENATEAYRKALDLNPNDKDAKFNLELLQKKKKMFDMKQNKRDEQRKDKPPPSQNQQKQKQQSQGGGAQSQEERPSEGKKDQEGTESGRAQEQNEKPEDEKDQTQPQAENLEGKQDQSESGEEKEEQGSEQPARPIDMQPAVRGAKPEEREGQIPRPILQGQMSQEHALRVLDAIKESEQELQLLRRPERRSDREPLKDW